MIHSRVTPQTLGFVRVWVFGIWLVIIASDPFHLVAELPSTIFVPFGIMRLIPADAWPWLLDTQFLQGFKFLLLMLLVLSILGVRPYRPIAIATAVMLTFHQGLVRGFGFVNHKELAILYAVYILALFPAADGFVWWKRKTKPAPKVTYSVALILMTLILLLAYSAISAHRIAYASPRIFLDNTMKYYIVWATFRSNYYNLSFGHWLLEYPNLRYMANLAFAITTIFEVLSPFCLIYRRFRYLWLAIIAPFHISTLFLMNIFFWQNLLLFPVLLVDINRFMSSFPYFPVTRKSNQARQKAYHQL